MTQHSDESPTDPVEHAFLNAYPNPDRVGCPGTDVLRGLADKTLPISHPARQHIGQCSPCFREFRLLEQQGWTKRRVQRYLGTITVMVTLILLGWSINHLRLSRLTHNNGRAAVWITMDLLKVSRTRGSIAELPVFKIPSSTVNLRIILPVGSDDGQYEVKIRKESASQVFETKGIAKIQDGDTTMVIYGLDFGGIPAGSYDLFFRHADASWQHVPILVG